MIFLWIHYDGIYDFSESEFFYDFFMIQFMFFNEFFYAFCFNCLHFLFCDFFKLFIDSIHFEKKNKTFQFVCCLLLNFLLHL